MKKWRVLLLDTKKSNPNHYICLAIYRAIGGNAHIETITKTDYKSAVRDALKHDCNLLIAFDGEELDRSIVEKVGSICRNKVLWVTEDPYERSVNASNADLFDLIFTNDSGSVDSYGAKGRHLPFAADPHFHFHSIPQEDSGHYFYDVFFAGTAWPNRSDFFKNLQQSIPSINLKLALPGNPYIPKPDLLMDLSCYDWRTPNTEFAKFANRSRTVLTLHRAFSASGNDPVAQTPGPRFFEVALSGGFQLVDTSIPEIRVDDFYVEGRDYVGFHGADDCVTKLKHYLHNSSDRLQIARSAQEKTFAEHLYANRVALLIDTVSESLPADQVQPINPAVDTTRRRVLVVSHNMLGQHPYGGVEVYQDVVRKKLGSEFEFLFYSPDPKAPGNSAYLLCDEQLDLIERFAFADQIDDKVLSSPAREAVFFEILNRYGVEAVHFQHLLGHAPSIALMPATLGIGTVLSLHDYYGICSRFNLLDYRGTFCNIDKLPIETCDVCLNAADGINAGSQARRRAFFSRLLQTIDVLHANTEGVADMYRDLYPVLRDSDNLKICGVPAPTEPKNSHVEHEGNRSKRLRIAIPGNIAPNKGGDTIIHALNQLRNDEVEFTVFGRLSEQYSEIIGLLKLSNVNIHGAFSPGELPSLLRGYDVSLHFSNWPETYCISLSEAWGAGLVPIVSDIGALGERVQDKVNGYKLPPGEAGSIVALVRRMISDRYLVHQVRDNLRALPITTQNEHMDWLRSIYNDLAPADAAVANPDANTGLSSRQLGFLLNSNTWVVSTAPPPILPLLSPVRRLPTMYMLAHRLYNYNKKYGPRKTVAKSFLKLWRRVAGK